MKAYTINQNNNVHIYDNYGTEKSIFDPCPTGWRVASGELWLEFTNTGLNPESMSGINYDNKYPNGYGINMYMQNGKMVRHLISRHKGHVWAMEEVFVQTVAGTTIMQPRTRTTE